MSKVSGILLVLVFIAPMLTAWILFQYFPDVVRGLGTTNHGEFVLPPRPVPWEGVPDIHGKKLSTEFIQHKWTLVYVAQEACGAECQGTLVKMHNIRLAQGPEMQRVQCLLLTRQAADDGLREFLQQHQDITAVRVAAAEDPLLQVFQVEKQGNAAMLPSVYLVDPRADLMMFYTLDSRDQTLQAEKGLIKDLKKLLKESKIG